MQNPRLIIFLSMFFVYVLTMGLYYQQTHALIIKDTETNIGNMLLTRRALSHLVSDIQKDEVNRLKDMGSINPDYFSPELLSSSFITLKLNEYANQERNKLHKDKLYFKYASPNPTNLENLASPFERKIYNDMNNKVISKYKEVVIRDGKNYLYYAIAGKKIKQRCLQCHGEPTHAPKMMIEKYGAKNGFHLKIGELSSIISVEAPLHDIYLENDKAFYKAALIIFCVFIILFYIAQKISQNILKKEQEVHDAELKHQQSYQKAQYLESSLEHLYEHVISSKFNKEGTITEVSEALCDLSGYTKDELIGRKMCCLKHPDVEEDMFSIIWSSLMKKETWTGEIKNSTKEGKVFWVEAIMRPIKDKEGLIVEFESIMRTITEKKALLEDINIDPLTTLLNRRSFEKQFSHEKSRAKRDHKFISLLMIDIDFFKQYNDNYGHQKGDEALKFVSESLKNSFRRSCDLVFRLGGEEFAVITSGDSKQKLIESAQNACIQLHQIHIPHIKSDIDPYLTISIGIAILEGQRDVSLNEIYKKSDEALYQAKGSGRNKVVAVEL